jgi:small subunit ribosomal protein S20
VSRQKPDTKNSLHKYFLKLKQILEKPRSHNWLIQHKPVSALSKAKSVAVTTRHSVQWFVLTLRKSTQPSSEATTPAATTAYNTAVPVLDRMADRGIIHKNKAARHKSRLNTAIKALQA